MVYILFNFTFMCTNIRRMIMIYNVDLIYCTNTTQFIFLNNINYSFTNTPSLRASSTRYRCKTLLKK